MISIIKHGEVYATSDELKAHAEKLTFNTREEYFEWVKQWKEEYNNVVLHYRINELFCRSHSRTWDGKGWQWTPMTSKKALYKQERIKRLESQVTIKETELRDRLTARIKAEYNYAPDYHQHSFYTLLHYLLAVRHASKLRAGKKREERLAAEKAST